METEQDENVEKRLGAIEKKIDRLADLITQTQLQEYRLSVVEKKLAETAEKAARLERRSGDAAAKWLGVAAGAVISVLVSYIAVKVGLK